jgi:hypothetical protein
MNVCSGSFARAWDLAWVHDNAELLRGSCFRMLGVLCYATVLFCIVFFLLVTICDYKRCILHVRCLL